MSMEECAASSVAAGSEAGMDSTVDNALQAMLQAVAFAAQAHQGQWRKDGRTPYVSHVFRVCLILRDLFQVTDRAVLMAAVLHDTIEDTCTDLDDLEEHFGSEVASWVAQLSKDKRLPFEAREQAYENVLAQAPWQVQVCKLADIYDNALDTATLPVEKRARALHNKQRYLQALATHLQPQAKAAFALTEQLLRSLTER